ncbi:MAG: biotin--[acetyl-CoA-carboxylase] ligase [Firmicutes bacterium]|nr:biotin--[acetyl-CoA-carboxylase] ligase [Bacillota bacterium]
MTLKQKLLSYFFSNQNIPLSGGELEKQFSVTRSAIWKAVNELKKDGFLIESKDRSGYVFLGDGDVLCREAIERNLATKSLGREIEILDSVDSTNFYLKRVLPKQEGYCVTADMQTGGHGRRERAFSSPKGGIYLSVLLKPVLPPEELQFMTLCTAVAVCEALEKICHFAPQVKWINDIYYNGKKLVGISTGASFSAENMSLESVIIGIGINVQKVKGTFEDIAISLEEITGKKGFRNALISEVLNRLEKCYNLFAAGCKKEILEKYKNRCFLLGNIITVCDGSKQYEANASHLTENGALVVVDALGNKKILNTEEVSVRITF